MVPRRLVQQPGHRHGSRRAVALLAVLACALAWAPAAGAQLPPLPGSETEPAPQSAAAPAVAPAAPGTTAVTAGQDLARSSASGDAALVPPYGLLWSADLGTAINAPVIAEGRVFVSRAAGGRDSRGSFLEALDAASGARQWSVQLDHPGAFVHLAHAPGRVFAVDPDGLVRAYEATTGRALWSTDLPSAQGAPVAAGDLLYSQGGDKLTALDVASGAIRWQVARAGAGNGEPAVAGDRLYVVHNTCSFAALDRRDGRFLWRSPCSGSSSSGARVVLWRDRLFAREAKPRFAATGEPAPGDPLDAVLGDVGLQWRDGTLVGVDAASGADRWRGYQAAQGLMVPGYALGLSGGTVTAYDAAIGTPRWTAVVRGPDIQASTPLTVRPGGAAGEGILVVPSGSVLAALVPVSRAAPEPLGVTIGGSADRVVGEQLDLRGTTGRVLTAAKVRLEQDRFPFGDGFKKLADLETDRIGGWASPRSIDRNTRYRVITPDGRVATTRTVYAYPSVAFGPIYGTRRRARVRVSVRMADDVRLTGRTLVLYHARARTRRLARLDVTRLRGSRGAASAIATFRVPARVGRRDFLFACVRGAAWLGHGHPAVIDRFCGRRTYRYG